MILNIIYSIILIILFLLLCWFIIWYFFLKDIPFFQDLAYQKLSNIIISTSTLGNIPQLQHGGFNPTGDDCYAIGYKVQKEYMEWMVTSHTGKNSQGLCDKIEEAMVDFEEAMG